MKRGIKIIAIVLMVGVLAAALPLQGLAAAYGTVCDAGEIFAREIKAGLKNGASDDQIKDGFAGALGHVVNVIAEGAFNVIAAGLTLIDRSVPNIKDYKSENVPAGTKEWLSEPAADAKWRMGYSRQLLTPADFGKKVYYKGGSGGAPWGMGLKMTEKYDDLYVRTVAMDDGRGKVIFTAIDCVGISNADVRKLRAAMADYAKENNIISINIGATHTHSAIDTQGVWGLIGQLRDNFFGSLWSILTKGFKSVSGIDQDYMKWLTEQTVKSVKQAVDGMEEGTLYYAKASTLDENGNSSFFSQRNDDSLKLIDEIYRLTFKPARTGAKPIMITNFGVHSETIGVIDEEKTMSADFVPYMEKVVNDAGFDFIFLQGAIGEMVMPNRGPALEGHENLARIDECRLYGEALGKFAVAMTGDEALPALLNIKHKEVLYSSDNSIVRVFSHFAATTNEIYWDKSKPLNITYVTEVGYLQIGGKVSVFLSPGETAPEIILGGQSMEAATSFRREDFPYKPLKDLIPGDLLVFDLMNDAAGYITPDSDYGLIAAKYRDGKMVFGTVDIMFSMGHDSASELVKAFLELADKPE